jgi:hypothetical protein
MTTDSFDAVIPLRKTKRFDFVCLLQAGLPLVGKLGTPTTASTILCHSERSNEVKLLHCGDEE